MTEVIQLGSRRTPEIRNGIPLQPPLYEDLPNFLSRPLTLLDKILWLPLERCMDTLKRLLRMAVIGFIVATSAIGCLSLYYLWSFHAGYMELTILSGNDLKQIASGNVPIRDYSGISELVEPKKQKKNQTN